jgi:hypothetical protein
MAHISINDLCVDRTLDRQAMARVRGGDGAPWVFGWIHPYTHTQTGAAPAINFYQINNYADQMINQFQTVNVNNSAPDSTVTVGVDGRSTNNGLA